MCNVYNTERQTEWILKIFTIFCNRYLEHHATLLPLRDSTNNDTVGEIENNFSLFPQMVKKK